MMKTKLFTAVLACLSVAMLFSGCKDDKNDDAVHAYVMRAAITEAGDLDALTVKHKDAGGRGITPIGKMITLHKVMEGLNGVRRIKGIY